jgi:hypothetical protein
MSVAICLRTKRLELRGTCLALGSSDKGGELDEVRQRERSLVWKCAIGQLDASLPRPRDDVVARHAVTSTHAA